MGTKGRTDIQNQYNQQTARLNEVYNSQVNALEGEKNTQLASIANWFAGAQQQVKQLVGQAGLGRSQDLQALATNVYNQAISAVNQLNTYYLNKKATLETWAMNQSKSIGELTQNLSAVGNYMASSPQLGSPMVTSEGQYYIPYGAGSTSTREKNIFGQYI